MEGMVKLVAPLSTESVPALGGSSAAPRIVSITFCNGPNLPAKSSTLFLDGFAEFLKNVVSAKIEDAVNRV